MTKNFTIIVDVDGTTLNLMQVLLDIYNVDYGDNLTVEDCIEWEFSNYVKPEAKDKINQYFEDPSLYLKIKPIPNAVEGIKLLKLLGHRVVFCTHSTIGASGVKYKKLVELGLIDDQNDYIECKDKSLVNGDYLIDDGFHNIKAFKSGIGILLTQPWNSKEDYKPRMKDWKEIVNVFRLMAERSEI